MATATKRNGTKRHGNGHTRHYSTRSNNYSIRTAKLPRSVVQQLEKIYSKSRKNVTKHPYKAAGSILLSLGLASSALLLVRYLRGY